MGSFDILRAVCPEILGQFLSNSPGGVLLENVRRQVVYFLAVFPGENRAAEALDGEGF
ncbi:MAG TPA: hypothetical protein VI816_04830 [Candidatus Bathyarchaeia archaeon]|nr:hypothetical protein [Candidatus Bathyarchaeia archaeon]